MANPPEWFNDLVKEAAESSIVEAIELSNEAFRSLLPCPECGAKATLSHSAECVVGRAAAKIRAVRRMLGLS